MRRRRRAAHSFGWIDGQARRHGQPVPGFVIGMPMPVGIRAALDAQERSLSLLEPAVRSG